MVSRVPTIKELARTVVHMLELVWLLSADSIGLRTPALTNLTGRERRTQRSGVVVVGVLPRRVGRDIIQMVVSIGVN